jgi:hypothetical protein
MPAPRLLPDNSELIAMVNRGMTQQEIADHVFKATGNRVTRAAVSAALARAGVPRARPRYDELLPWRVRVEHDSHYAPRMLRAEARRRAGVELPAKELRRLEAWKETLLESKAVVHYDPEAPGGFFYVPVRKGVDTDLIRVPTGQMGAA